MELKYQEVNLFFVDSDDYLNNNAIKILMEKMDENIVDVVAGGYKVVSEKDYDKQEYFCQLNWVVMKLSKI